MVVTNCESLESGKMLKPNFLLEERLDHVCPKQIETSIKNKKKNKKTNFY